MNNNNATFYPGQKIVRMGPSNTLIKKDEVYTSNGCHTCGCGVIKVYILELPIEEPMRQGCDCGKSEPNRNGHYCGNAKLFAPLHYSSITAELAAQVQVGDTQDVKTKEVVCS
jgi:hypothetical protein